MIRLRPAEPQDRWIFYRLRRQIQPEISLADHDTWWADVWEHRFVAYDGPVMVGVIRVRPSDGAAYRSDPLRAEYDGILSLLVTEKERGKGLGTQMLVSIKRVAKELGFIRLQATVTHDNLPSQRAFMSAEYRPTQFEVVL